MKTHLNRPLIPPHLGRPRRHQSDRQPRLGPGIQDPAPGRQPTPAQAARPPSRESPGHRRSGPPQPREGARTRRSDAVARQRLLGLGGGDFETPLEAAAHTGQRAIAEYLLSKGARPSLYAAGMLGQLDLVKAFLATDPQAHLVPGPHGFTLFHCVKQGGPAAQPVLDWLLAQGVPAVAQRPLPFVWPEGTTPPQG